MRYTVVYEQAPRNYAAFVPLLPVVVVTAPTLVELEREARSAIAFHLGDALAADDLVTVELVSHDDYTGPVVTLDGEDISQELAASASRR